MAQKAKIWFLIFDELRKLLSLAIEEKNLKSAIMFIYKNTS